MNRIFVWIVLAFMCFSCQKTKKIYIASALADCQGEAPQKCMHYKENPTDDWNYFYDTIEGFDYEEGHQYLVEVAVTEIENPPADASSLKYTLVKILSKEKDASFKNHASVDTTTEQEKKISYVVYEAFSRGSFFYLKINETTIEKSIDRSLKNPASKKCSKKEWQNILSYIEKINLEKISELQAPSEKSHTDRALQAQLKISTPDLTFTSSNFDHGNPPKEIESLVNTMLSLAESIE